ncbi:MAG: peptidase [Clostridiales bacterium]|nr:peptidase [Clostridiales bacterium]
MKRILNRVRFALTLALAFALTCGLGLTASAADTPSLDFSQTGSVTLTLADGSGNVVSDGAVTIYEVAELYLDDGNMAYAYTDAFSGCTEALDVEDAALAAALADYVTEHGVSGTAASIGADGTVRFDGLELGLYLVVQTTKSTGYSTISPFLVTVPYAEGGAWVYAVNASPKVEVSAEPETPEEPNEPEEPEEPETTTTTTTTTTTKTTTTATTLPQTGQLNWPVPVLAVSGLVLFGLGWYLFSTDRKKEHHAA